MQPDPSEFPTLDDLPAQVNPSTQAASPTTRTIPSLIGGIVAAIVIIGFLATLLVIRGGSHPSVIVSAPTTATVTNTSGTPFVTATTLSSATDDTPTPSQAPALTPTSTLTSHGSVRVTQNQNEQQQCINSSAPYTVSLINDAQEAATWHVNVPNFNNALSAHLEVISRSSYIPASAPLAWAQVTPQDGSIAAGQTASLVINPLVSMPCAGSPPYYASVQIKFASGLTQADIQLSYVGTGPSPLSNVVVSAGSLTVTQTCPPWTTTPSITFSIKNIGTGIGYPYLETGGWASVDIAYDPANPAVTTWIYPNETWTFTIAPSSGVQCGSTYYIYIHINNTGGVSTTTLAFADTFQ